ncbi:titin homolog isoform X2 [Belonocnema kinseyi]|uniref:titin homolog isoform X2 n=1 Tax=Belonocnema kinseyi TaxID=2817044 RepID=UPI00143CEC76|nr:titin homolog isoform X2 [Belonocnema kinseyi]
MRYHVIYSMFYIIMHLTRGHFNKSESFLIRNHKNPFELDNQDYSLLKASNTILKNLKEDHKKSFFSDYAPRKFKTPFSTRYGSRKNQKLKRRYSKARRFIEKEENFAGTDINFERFNHKNFFIPPGSQNFNHNLSLFGFSEILPNSSFLEGNHEKSDNKFSFVKIDDRNTEFYKLRTRKSSKSGDQNFESKNNQMLEKVLSPKYKLEDASTLESASKSIFETNWMAEKGFRRKRGIDCSSKPRSRKRGFRNRPRKENRKYPCKVGTHQIIRLFRDQKAQNFTVKKNSNKNFENVIRDQKNKDLVSRSNNQLPGKKISKTDRKVRNQVHLSMKNPQPKWQVQEEAAPLIFQDQVLLANQDKSLINRENPNIHLFENLNQENKAPLSCSKNLNSINVLNKDQHKYLQNTYSAVATSFPSQDTVSSSSLANGNTLEEDKNSEVVPKPILVAKSTENKSVNTTSDVKSTHDESANNESIDDKKTNLELDEGRKIDDYSAVASTKLKRAIKDLKSPTKDENFSKINIIENNQENFMNKSITMKSAVKETHHLSTSFDLRFETPTFLHINRKESKKCSFNSKFSSSNKNVGLEPDYQKNNQYQENKYDLAHRNDVMHFLREGVYVAESSLNTPIRTTIESVHEISRKNNWIQLRPSPVEKFFFEIEKETGIFLQTTSSLETVGENNSLASDDAKVQLEINKINMPSSRRIKRSSSLALDNLFKDESVKISSSNVNFDNFSNQSQDPKIRRSSEIEDIASNKVVKISQPVMDLNITNFFSELENFGHETNPSHKDQFFIDGKLSHSHNLQPPFKRDSNSPFLQFQKFSSTMGNDFMDFHPRNLDKKIVDSESRQGNTTSIVKKRKNVGTDLSKYLFTKVIRKRSNPAYETLIENDNSDIYNDDDSHENIYDYQLKNKFLGEKKDNKKIDEKAYRGFANVGDKRSHIENPRFDNIEVKEDNQVKNQPRRMDHENIQPEDKGGLFSTFGHTNLAREKNEKSGIDLNIKWKKFNHDAIEIAKNIREDKLLVNQETSNQISEPRKDVNLQNSERGKHNFPNKISKGGVLIRIKKSDFGSKHSKRKGLHKHMKKMKSRHKLSTSDLRMKSSKNRKKYSKGRKSSKKKIENKNEKKNNHRGIRSTFSVPKKNIYKNTKIKRKNKENKRNIEPFRSAQKLPKKLYSIENDLRAGTLLKKRLKTAAKKIPESSIRIKNSLKLINTNKDIRNKAKLSRLGRSLQDNHQSDEEKYEKPGYIRLGRRLQSLSRHAETKAEFGEIRQESFTPENSSNSNKPKVKLSTTNVMIQIQTKAVTETRTKTIIEAKTKTTTNNEEKLVTDKNWGNWGQVTAYQNVLDISNEARQASQTTTASKNTVSPSTEEYDFKDYVEHYTDESVITTETNSDDYEEEDYEEEYEEYGEDQAASDGWTYMTDYEDALTSNEAKTGVKTEATVEVKARIKTEAITSEILNSSTVLNTTTFEQVRLSTKVPEKITSTKFTLPVLFTTEDYDYKDYVEYYTDESMITTEKNSNDYEEKEYGEEYEEEYEEDKAVLDTWTYMTDYEDTLTSTQKIGSTTERKIAAKTVEKTQNTVEAEAGVKTEAITSEMVKPVTASKTTKYELVQPTTKIIEKSISTEFILPVAFTTGEYDYKDSVEYYTEETIITTEKNSDDYEKEEEYESEEDKAISDFWTYMPHYKDTLNSTYEVINSTKAATETKIEAFTEDETKSTVQVKTEVSTEAITSDIVKTVTVPKTTAFLKMQPSTKVTEEALSTEFTLPNAFATEGIARITTPKTTIFTKAALANISQKTLFKSTSLDSGAKSAITEEITVSSDTEGYGEETEKEETIITSTEGILTIEAIAETTAETTDIATIGATNDNNKENLVTNKNLDQVKADQNLLDNLGQQKQPYKTTAARKSTVGPSTEKYDYKNYVEYYTDERIITTEKNSDDYEEEYEEEYEEKKVVPDSWTYITDYEDKLSVAQKMGSSTERETEATTQVKIETTFEVETEVTAEAITSKIVMPVTAPNKTEFQTIQPFTKITEKVTSTAFTLPVIFATIENDYKDYIEYLTDENILTTEKHLDDYGEEYEEEKVVSNFWTYMPDYKDILTSTQEIRNSTEATTKRKIKAFTEVETRVTTEAITSEIVKTVTAPKTAASRQVQPSTEITAKAKPTKFTFSATLTIENITIETEESTPPKPTTNTKVASTNIIETEDYGAESSEGEKFFTSTERTLLTEASTKDTKTSTMQLTTEEIYLKALSSETSQETTKAANEISSFAAETLKALEETIETTKDNLESAGETTEAAKLTSSSIEKIPATVERITKSKYETSQAIVETTASGKLVSISEEETSTSSGERTEDDEGILSSTEDTAVAEEETDEADKITSSLLEVIIKGIEKTFELAEVTTEQVKLTSNSEEEIQEIAERTTEGIENTSEAVDEVTEAPEETTPALTGTSEAVEETTEDANITFSFLEKTSEAMEITSKVPEVTTKAEEERTEPFEETSSILESIVEATEGTSKITKAAVIYSIETTNFETTIEEKTLIATSESTFAQKETSEIIKSRSTIEEETTDELIKNIATSSKKNEEEMTYEATESFTFTKTASIISSISTETSTVGFTAVKETEIVSTISEFITGTTVEATSESSSLSSEVISELHNAETTVELASTSKESMSGVTPKIETISESEVTSEVASKLTTAAETEASSEVTSKDTSEAVTEYTTEVLLGATSEVTTETTITKTIVAESPISIQSNELPQDTFTASQSSGTTYKVKTSIASENEATKITEAASLETIMVDITEETIEQEVASALTWTTDGLLTSFNTELTTLMNSSVIQTESSVPESVTKILEDTSFMLETKVGSNTEMVTSSFESNISKTQNSSRNQAKNLEEPNIETATKPGEAYDNYNFDYDYNYKEGIESYSDHDKEAAYGVLGMENRYEYDEDQFKNGTDEQPGANTSTRETTEFDHDIGTMQNKSKEEAAFSKNPEKETIADESASIPVLSSESNSSSTIINILSELPTLDLVISEKVKTLEIGAQTIVEESVSYSFPETSTQLGTSAKGSLRLEETSAKHDASILTEITSGFSSESTTIKGEYKTESTGKIKMNLESGVTSAEISTLSSKADEEEEKKKEIEDEKENENLQKEASILTNKEETNKTSNSTTKTLIFVTITFLTTAKAFNTTTETYIPTTICTETASIKTIPTIISTLEIETPIFTTINSHSAGDLKELKEQKEIEEELKKTEKELEKKERELIETEELIIEKEKDLRLKQEKIKEDEKRKLQEIIDKQKELEQKVIQLKEAKKKEDEEAKKTKEETEEKEEEVDGKEMERRKGEKKQKSGNKEEETEVEGKCEKDGKEKEEGNAKKRGKEEMEKQVEENQEKGEAEEKEEHERACLNVLKSSTFKEVLINRQNNIVTKFVCLPRIPKNPSDQKTSKRLARKLMTLTENASEEVDNFRILKRNLNSKLKKRATSLKLKVPDWNCNEPIVRKNAKRSIVEDTTLKLRKYVIDKNKKKIRTTNVNRLENHELTEGPTDKKQFHYSEINKRLSERKKRNFSWKKFWNCLKNSAETSTIKKVLVVEPEENNSWPPEIKYKCETKTTLDPNLCTSEGLAPTASTISSPTERITKIMPDKKCPVEEEESATLATVEPEKEEIGETTFEEITSEETTSTKKSSTEKISTKAICRISPKNFKQKENKNEEKEDYDFGEIDYVPTKPDNEDEDDEGYDEDEEKDEENDKEPENENSVLTDCEVEEKKYTTSKIDESKETASRETTSEEIRSAENSSTEETLVQKTSVKEGDTKNSKETKSDDELGTIGTATEIRSNTEVEEEKKKDYDYGEIELVTMTLNGENEGHDGYDEYQENYEDEGYDDEEEDSKEPEGSGWSFYEDYKEETEEKTEKTIKENKSSEESTKTSDVINSNNSVKENKEQHLRVKKLKLISEIENLKQKQTNLRSGILNEGKRLKKIQKAVPKTSPVKKDSNFFKESTRKMKSRQNDEKNFNDAPSNEKYNNLESSRSNNKIYEKIDRGINQAKNFPQSFEKHHKIRKKAGKSNNKRIGRSLQKLGKNNYDYQDQSFYFNPDTTEGLELSLMTPTILYSKEDNIRTTIAPERDFPTVLKKSSGLNYISSKNIKSTIEAFQKSGLDEISTIKINDSPFYEFLRDDDHFAQDSTNNKKVDQSNNYYIQKLSENDSPKEMKITESKFTKKEASVVDFIGKSFSDIGYKEGDKKENEKDYEDLIDDKGFGRSLLTISEIKNSKAHQNKKGLERKKHNKDIKGHKKEKDQKNHKNHKKKGRKDYQKNSRYHKNKESFHDSTTPKNNKFQETKKRHEITNSKLSQIDMNGKTGVSINKKNIFNIKRITQQKRKIDDIHKKNIRLLKKQNL